ncbi:MAG: hypothetical protein QXH42_09980 [Thermoplasmata archaeon]
MQRVGARGAPMNRKEMQRLSRRLADPENLRRLFMYWNIRGRGLEEWRKRKGKRSVR